MYYNFKFFIKDTFEKYNLKAMSQIFIQFFLIFINKLSEKKLNLNIAKKPNYYNIYI